jgi:hypothetical protein
MVCAQPAMLSEQQLRLDDKSRYRAASSLFHCTDVTTVGLGGSQKLFAMLFSRLSDSHVAVVMSKRCINSYKYVLDVLAALARPAASRAFRAKPGEVRSLLGKSISVDSTCDRAR